MRRGQEGFTLIELVVVIVILGILAAVALPRFVDLTSEAEESAAKGLKGGLGAAVSLVHGKALASNASGSVTIQGNSVSINSSAWPTFSSADDLVDMLQSDPRNNGWTFTTGGAGGCSNLPNGNTPTECLERTNNNWKIGYDDVTGTVAITDS